MEAGLSLYKICFRTSKTLKNQDIYHDIIQLVLVNPVSTGTTSVQKKSAKILQN